VTIRKRPGLCNPDPRYPSFWAPSSGRSFYRQLGRDAEGERALRAAIARGTAAASLQHALGLLLVRQGHEREALAYLAVASRLDPANARFTYVYAVALNGAGQTNQAMGMLEDEIRKHPYDPDALAALARSTTAVSDLQNDW
jgi:predicted Zn-dependent protease